MAELLETMDVQSRLWSSRRAQWLTRCSDEVLREGESENPSLGCLQASLADFFFHQCSWTEE